MKTSKAVDKTTAEYYGNMKTTVAATSQSSSGERIKINEVANAVFAIEGSTLNEKILTHAEYGETLLVTGTLKFTDSEAHTALMTKPVAIFLNGKRRETYEEAINAGTNVQEIIFFTQETINLKSGRDYIPMEVKAVQLDDTETKEDA
jgi:hypothetical protein